MICTSCGSKKDAAFFTEDYTCKCGEKILFEYNMCPDCGLMWRSVNGEVMKNSVIHIDDFSNAFMIPPTKLEPADEDMLKNMEKELSKVDKIRRGESTSMADYIHNCLKCGAVAHEAKNGLYKCSECGFEWEVVSFE